MENATPGAQFFWHKIKVRTTVPGIQFPRFQVGFYMKVVGGKWLVPARIECHNSHNETLNGLAG
jgi:hypothetical protein